MWTKPNFYNKNVPIILLVLLSSVALMDVSASCMMTEDIATVETSVSYAEQNKEILSSLEQVRKTTAENQETLKTLTISVADTQQSSASTRPTPPEVLTQRENTPPARDSTIASYSTARDSTYSTARDSTIASMTKAENDIADVQTREAYLPVDNDMKPTTWAIWISNLSKRAEQISTTANAVYDNIVIAQKKYNDSDFWGKVSVVFGGALVASVAYGMLNTSGFGVATFLSKLGYKAGKSILDSVPGAGELINKGSPVDKMLASAVETGKWGVKAVSESVVGVIITTFLASKGLLKSSTAKTIIKKFFFK